MKRQYTITVTVLTDDEPLTQDELNALDQHMTPSSVVVFGDNEEEHFFIEDIQVEAKTLEL